MNEHRLLILMIITSLEINKRYFVKHVIQIQLVYSMSYFVCDTRDSKDL